MDPISDQEATQLFKELEELYHESVLGGIKAWGVGLVKGRDSHSGTQWDGCWKLLKLSHNEAELDAAIAVGEGRLDPALFPDGVTHSKVLGMSTRDQERLLSGTRFQVYEDSGTGGVANLTWREMTPIQRNRLISPKGSRILTLAEQTPPKGPQPVKVGLFVSAGYHSGDGYLTLRNGQKEARISLPDLAEALDQDTFDVLVEDMRNTFGAEDTEGDE
jgi:hypothetical protein